MVRIPSVLKIGLFFNSVFSSLWLSSYIMSHEMHIVFIYFKKTETNFSKYKIKFYVQNKLT